MNWKTYSDIQRLLGVIEGASIAAPNDVSACIADAVMAISDILDDIMGEKANEEPQNTDVCITATCLKCPICGSTTIVTNHSDEYHWCANCGHDFN